MEVTGFPTSCDIYLELDGRKVAVVQSYTAKATKTSQVVEAFGESEPVATINGQSKYVLELTRLYATDDAISDGIDFFALEDFSLVISKPDRKVIYSGCQWSAIQEEGKVGSMVAEKVTVVATGRIEVAAIAGPPDGGAGALAVEHPASGGGPGGLHPAGGTAPAAGGGPGRGRADARLPPDRPDGPAGAGGEHGL